MQHHTTSNADRAAGPCACEYCLSNMPVVDAPRTRNDIEPLVSQLAGVKSGKQANHLKWCTCDQCIHTRSEPCRTQQHLALEADLTAGVLRFNDPKQLEELVMIARAMHGLWITAQNTFNLDAQQIDLLRDVASVNIPGDDLD